MHYPIIQEPPVASEPRITNPVYLPKDKPVNLAQNYNLEEYFRTGRVSTEREPETRKSDERNPENFQYYTSWGRYDRSRYSFPAEKLFYFKIIDQNRRL